MGTDGKLKLDHASIATELARGGWPCAHISDDTWRTGFSAFDRDFPIFMRVAADGYVTFAIVPFVKSPEDLLRAKHLYVRLLELNHKMLMAKFSIDDDLDVVLSIEYPIADFDRSELVDAMNAVCTYTKAYYPALLKLTA